jgi:restriction system protein
VAFVVFGLEFLANRRWIWGVAFGFIGALHVALWIDDRRVERHTSMRAVDAMSGRQFERWLAWFFEQLGFDVEKTPYAGDYGADLILTWNGIRIAVQVKSGHQNVGVSAVQQVFAARVYYGCEQSMVVTNQYFTEQALLLAEKLGVRMRHRSDIVRVLRRFENPRN